MRKIRGACAESRSWGQQHGEGRGHPRHIALPLAVQLSCPRSRSGAGVPPGQLAGVKGAVKLL